MAFERYKSDIDKLVEKGKILQAAMHFAIFPDDRKKVPVDKFKHLLDFKVDYQTWYSDALSVVSQLLPDRRDDFISYYKPLKSRKSLDPESYTISDYLRGLGATRGLDTVVDGSAAFQPFEQQVRIVEALKQRLESSLFDIRTLMQADLFENELDAAHELNSKGFERAAGAVAGVVLEGHLETVCSQHKIATPKNGTISRLNDLLKEKDNIDTLTWRFIQRLTDLRNLCDHKRGRDPTKDEIEELITGVRKITKTVY